ncbi:MAG TPA: hypothetical protein VGO50_11580 [Pyrinomonadaceae bacterium]|jgi:hypothetical protein|nr:hypothetical protein [Pyrinomonadaceae bacterium]
MMTKNKDEKTPNEIPRPVSVSGVILQAWLSIAVWMSFGLLLESLIGYRVPAYLRDELRREIFRLAHTHGALLNLVLLEAALCIDRELVRPSKMGLLSLRLGAVLMPVGFLLGGIWHTEGEPGIGVWLAPLGGVLVILGAVNLAISSYKPRH